MKTLKTLLVLLLSATGVFAQVDPNNLLINGYVTNANGNAQEGVLICVDGVDQPNFPLDSLCTTTNANGYYFLVISNGSVTGPNHVFTISLDDPCPIAPTYQTASVSNEQGTVDVVNLDWVLCAPNNNACDASFTSSNDSLNGTWTFVANATGTAPFTYDWWVDGTSYSTPSVSHMFNGGTVGVYLTVTDANGCVSDDADSLFLGGGNTCGVQIDYQLEPNLGGSILTANPSGTAPFTYLWNTGQETASIFPAEPLEGTYCVTIADDNGCQSTACYTFAGNNGCDVEITSYWDTINGDVVYFCGTTGNWASYLWSDGSTGATTTAENISPNGEGICVTVTDANGCVATSCDTLLPPNTGGCQAGFSYPGSANGVLLVGDTVQLMFDGVAGLISTFDWTFSAGGLTFTATDMNPVFVTPPTLLPINGMNVDICVTVTDILGNCTDTYCQTVLAVPNNNTNNCDANYSWVIDSMLGAPLPGVQFTDLSSEDATYWYWDFGDGATSTDQNPLHLYNGNGPFVVCLTIVTPNPQCQSTFCDTVYVGTNPGNCDASFSNSGETPIGYTFSANVQDPNLFYYWEIDNIFVGDGYDAYAPGFTNGTHTVCLTIIDSLVGCSDTQCLTITIGSPNCYGYVSGQAYAGSNNQPLFDGVVYLITFDANSNQLTVVDSIVLDTSNSFFFGALPCGDYLVKAAAYSGSPYYSNHIPTYHGNSPFWGFAQALTIGQPNQIVTADVTLIAASNPGGPGFIGGDVTEGANKTDPGDVLSGMQVMIFNLSGDAIAYTYTDGNGEFGFSNLAYGTYQVYVEALGVQTIPAVVTIGPDSPSEEGVHIFASESLISTGIEEFDFDGAISEVYPNPVANQASIKLNLDAALMINVSVVDLTGRTISSQTISAAGGENTINVSADELKNGYYFLNIQDVDNNFSVTRKFMRID
jgi:PKD repeat protein